MIVTSILGNIKDFDTKGKTIDLVKISPDDRLKQVLRVRSVAGEEIGIRLDNTHLHNGDVLFENEKYVFVVDFLAQDVILIKPKDLDEMGFIAHSIGNKHIPAIIENGEIIIEDDYLIIEWLSKCGFNYEKAKKVLSKALRHASHTH